MAFLKGIQKNLESPLLYPVPSQDKELHKLVNAQPKMQWTQQHIILWSCYKFKCQLLQYIFSWEDYLPFEIIT